MKRMKGSVNSVRPDVLMVVADDLWVGDLSDEVAPVLWGLAEESRVYTRCYSHPVCWQSRASLLWGVYGRHFEPAIVEAMGVQSGPEPGEGVVTMPGLLQQAGYETCLVGKWHCGRRPGEPSGPMAYMGAPQARGFGAWRAGAPSNLGSWTQPWTRVDGDVITQESEYATVAQVEAGIEWWSAIGHEPRFLQVSLSAPHPPFHAPPDELLGGYVPGPGPLARQNYERMVRSVDWAVGRLLEAVGEETVVVFTADNGCPILPPGMPDGHKKGTTFEPGIRVPLSIRKPGLTPGYNGTRLVHVVDVPATILELAGVEVPSGWDGMSLFGPGRADALSEAVMVDDGIEVHDVAAVIDDPPMKLRVVDGGPEELYDLAADPQELVLLPTDVETPELVRLRGVLSS